MFNFSLEAYENKKISLENFSIHQYEVTIFEFQKYSETNNIITEAEKTGGGYEWGAGWVKRKGWNYKTPYGKKPDSIYEPAVHISRFEAEAYCKSIEGRLLHYKFVLLRHQILRQVFQVLELRFLYLVLH